MMNENHTPPPDQVSQPEQKKKRAPRGTYKKRDPKKKKKPGKKSPLNAEKANYHLLCYHIGDDTYSDEIKDGEIDISVKRMFAENPDIEEIYLLKATKVFKKPVYETIDL
jgi:hypothetical protein